MRTNTFKTPGDFMAENIYGLVAAADGAENVEIIDLDDETALLRSKELPDVAFVMWKARYSGTAAVMRLRGRSQDEFGCLVVCACCRRKPPFRNLLFETCNKFEINTVLMRKASWMATEWRTVSARPDHDRRFRDNDELENGEQRERETADGKIICVEAKDYRGFGPAYVQEEIDHAFRFIIGMK